MPKYGLTFLIYLSIDLSHLFRAHSEKSYFNIELLLVNEQF
jgi:hypothetical protein